MEEYEEKKENDDDDLNDNSYHHLTASTASLDAAVQQTRRRTHLGQLLAPGGDYDESHVTPQLMAYMTRLAIYENDYNKPQTLNHTNSTFKDQPKPSSPHSNSSDNTAISSFDGISEQTENIEDGTKIFPSNHTIKEQQKIPAHLNASDEELYLFLRNPPSHLLPLPFYPKNINFINYDKPKKYKNNKMNKKSKTRNTKKPYFAAPNTMKNDKEVTIKYIYSQSLNKEETKNEQKNANKNNKNNEDILSLSISDEYHQKMAMELIEKKEKNILSPKTKQMQNAINDATNTSLLEHVDLATSQTLSAINSPRNEQRNDNVLHGNFANLSIDDEDSS